MEYRPRKKATIILKGLTLICMYYIDAVIGCVGFHVKENARGRIYCYVVGGGFFFRNTSV